MFERACEKNKTKETHRTNELRFVAIDELLAGLVARVCEGFVFRDKKLLIYRGDWRNEKWGVVATAGLARVQFEHGGMMETVR